MECASYSTLTFSVMSSCKINYLLSNDPPPISGNTEENLECSNFFRLNGASVVKEIEGIGRIWKTNYNISVGFLKLKILIFYEYVHILYHWIAEALQIPVVFESNHYLAKFCKV